MKSREFIFCLCSSLAVLPGPLLAGTAAKNAEPPQPAKTDAPVILKLMQRDRIVTVKSGAKGPLYTVETKAGEVLVRDTDVEQLKASNPKLYDIVKDAIAGASGLIDASLGGKTPQTKIDASIDK